MKNNQSGCKWSNENHDRFSLKAMNMLIINLSKYLIKHGKRLLRITNGG